MAERVGYYWEHPKEKPPKHPKGCCQYCGKPLDPGQRKWCRGSNHGRLYWLYFVPKKIYWNDWRVKVLRRDGFKCQDCGKTRKELDDFDTLEVHHIKPISEGGPEFDMDNCITLCTKCHKKPHASRKSPNKKYTISDDQLKLSDFFTDFSHHVFGAEKS